MNRPASMTGAGALLLAATLLVAATFNADAQDEAKYPDWTGHWWRNNPVQWDPTLPPGRGQRPPLTPEYQGIWAASLDRLDAGTDDNAVVSCLPPGMPRTMIVYEPMEIVIQRDTTYLLVSYFSEFRRVFTDGRDWPKQTTPAFRGYSIGTWEDTDGDGRYDTLAIETRGMRGPRTFDSRHIPLHKDNQTIVKERLSLDKTNRDILRNEITTIDHALTQPWTVSRSYRRLSKPAWVDYACAENNNQVVLGGENYMVGGDGLLMPTRKDQPAPDLRRFAAPK